MIKTKKQIKEEMIAEAKSIHGEITPCDRHKDFSTCFTYEGKLMFWFNDKTNNTKVIISEEEI